MKETTSQENHSKFCSVPVYNSAVQIIKTLSLNGSLLVIGHPTAKWIADTQVPEKHLRQILFWDEKTWMQSEKDNSERVQPVKPTPISPYHAWASSPDAAHWNQLGQFDTIWLLPETTQSLTLDQFQPVFTSLCQQTHFIYISLSKTTLSKWVKQAGRQKTKASRQTLQTEYQREILSTQTIEAPKSLYFIEMEAFFKAHLPGVFWAHTSEDMFHLVATQKVHEAGELETLQAQLNQMIQFELALSHWKQNDELIKQDARLSKASQLAKFLTKKPLQL